MVTEIKALDADGLGRFQALRVAAVEAVTKRFYATHGSAYERFGTRGQDACREDLAYHLDFLRPVLEFGLLQPMVDYLCWLASILTARAIPAEHLAQSLDWLAEFFAGHMDAPHGSSVAAALQAVRTGFLEAGTAPVTPPRLHEPWLEASAFEAALLAGKQPEALAVMHRCMDNGHTLVEVGLHVIQPALYEIGEKWQANRISVAQEHMATAMVQSLMTVGLLRSPPPSPTNKKVLLGCVAGNDHDVGLRLVADAFLLAGWDVQYLGANVPTVALVRHITEWKPDLVGLSVSFAQQLPAVKAVVAQLVERLGNSRPALIVGGLAINRFNRLGDLVGADGFSVNAPTAVIAANQILRKKNIL